MRQLQEDTISDIRALVDVPCGKQMSDGAKKSASALLYCPATLLVTPTVCVCSTTNVAHTREETEPQTLC